MGSPFMMWRQRNVFVQLIVLSMMALTACLVICLNIGISSPTHASIAQLNNTSQLYSKNVCIVIKATFYQNKHINASKKLPSVLSHSSSIHKLLNVNNVTTKMGKFLTSITLNNALNVLLINHWLSITSAKLVGKELSTIRKKKFAWDVKKAQVICGSQNHASRSAQLNLRFTILQTSNVNVWKNTSI